MRSHFILGAVVYIAHDLTTAFQISDNIVVLYQGSVVEAGDVEKVSEASSLLGEFGHVQRPDLEGHEERGYACLAAAQFVPDGS